MKACCNTRWRQLCLLLGAYALLHGPPETSLAQAANTPIVTLEVNPQQLEVQIELPSDLEQLPRHFATDQPAGIVLDLPPGQHAGLAHVRQRFPATLEQDLLDSYSIIHHAERTRLVLHLTRPASYTVYSSARSIRIGIANQPAARLAADTDTTASDNISLNFQQIEVRALLQVFAEFTGLNIVASDSVNGTLTLRLQDVPWRQALAIILQARGLEMREHGRVLWVAPRAELQAREQAELEQQAQLAALEPLHTEVFQLNYQNATTFRKLFGVRQSNDAEAHPHLLSRRGSTIVDQRTNQLFVTDTRRVLENVRALLAKVDVPSRQVLIEARIVEADDAFSRHLGARLGFSAGMPAEAATLPARTGSNAAINLPAPALGSFEAGNFALSLFNASANRVLNLELSALEADGRGQIISSPRVVTADQQAALIEQGEEIPYQQSTSSGATSVAFKKANLKLEVTPQITPDGNVILNVDISKDSRGIATAGGLAINTKHVKTQVQVEDGGTVVIGGIYTKNTSDTIAKVPLLGDLPLLGLLFRHTAKVANKTELLIFLTPKIVATDNLRQ